MNYRVLGKTGLKVSEVGFGAWAIGGPVMAGDIPIGWGNVNDEESKRAILKSVELGINFFDTADFYGLGHSEEILGEVFHNRWDDIILATKVGHQLNDDGTISLNYTKEHILSACEKSLKRLRKNVIDIYQLHSAKVEHLEKGECIEAMEKLKQEGKIRFWGISLLTYAPEPEAKFLIERNLGDTFQLVFNIINQKALEEVIPLAYRHNYGIIARMPIQFGLLTGKFSKGTLFEKNDHRSFRLKPNVLNLALDKLEKVFPIADKYGISKTALAMSFVLSHPEISTTIVGIKNELQAEENVKDIMNLSIEDLEFLHNYYRSDLVEVVNEMIKNL